MAKKIKIKKKWAKWIVVIIILVIIGLLYIPTLEKKEEPEIKPEVVEVIVPETEAGGAKFGDLMKINYVLSLEDGTAVDTNNETIAEKYGIDRYVKGPYRFILGQSDKLYGAGGKVKPFDDAIKGLNVGDKKTIKIQPTDSVLAFEINISDKKQRRISIPTVHIFSQKKFKELFLEPAVVGNVVSNSDKYPWPYQIVNVTNKSIAAKILIENGDEIVLPGTEWKSLALDVGDRMIIFVQNPEIGQVITTPYGKANIINVTTGYIWMEHEPELDKEFIQTVDVGKEKGLTFDFKVWKVEEDSFIIRRINYLQQEKLDLYVEVLEIVPGVKELD